MLAPVDSSSLPGRLAAIKLAWEDLNHLDQAEQRAISRHLSVSNLTANTIASLPDPDTFIAGGLHRCYPALDAYFDLTGNHSKDAKTVRKIAKHGLKLSCVPALDPRQNSIPNIDKKRDIVRQMLRHATSPFTPRQLLEAAAPQQVHFPNHRSAFTYSDFTTTEIASMLSKGVVKEWPFPEPPTVINAIRVVDDKAPKLRFCINPM